MCGIVYAKSLKNHPVNAHIIDQFMSQRSRGTQGFGLFDAEYGNMVKNPEEGGIISWLKKYPSKEILFHHRWPTSTDNVKNACHPFSTKDFFKTCYILVHNGWLTNADELKIEHEKLGIKYSSEQPDGKFNDSEALLWEFALYMEGKKDKIDTTGPVAFICIALDEKGGDKLHYGRNTNPLHMYKNNKKILLSSEGKGSMIPADKLHTYDYKSGLIVTKKLVLAESYNYVYNNNSSVERVGRTYRHDSVSSFTPGSYAHDSYDDYQDEDEIENFSLTAVELEMLEADNALYDMSSKEFKEEIADMYSDYLDLADGVYHEVFNMLSMDIDRAEREIKENEDLEARIHLCKLQACISKLCDDPFWGDKAPIHPLYITKQPIISKLSPMAAAIMRQAGGKI